MQKYKLHLKETKQNEKKYYFNFDFRAYFIVLNFSKKWKGKNLSSHALFSCLYSKTINAAYVNFTIPRYKVAVCCIHVSSNHYSARSLLLFVFNEDIASHARRWICNICVWAVTCFRTTSWWHISIKFIVHAFDPTMQLFSYNNNEKEGKKIKSEAANRLNIKAYTQTPQRIPHLCMLLICYTGSVHTSSDAHAHIERHTWVTRRQINQVLYRPIVS